MTAPESHPQRLRVAHLSPHAANSFTLRPDQRVRDAIAEELGITALKKLEFHGEVYAEGRDDWILNGQLAASVVQPCVVSLRPVDTRLSQQVRRRYSLHIRQPDGDEVEMPDDTLEPLGQFIDLTAVMVEELLLALPEYPRADGIKALQTEENQPEADTRRPFAGLDKLLKKDTDQG